jgi:small-conductance mechanosensitive channel
VSGAQEAAEDGRSFSEFVADNRDAIIVTPIHIVVIILLALVIRWLLFRAINRMVRSTAESDVPVVLRPLRERLNNGTEAGVAAERRRQRAETVGSLLRSITSLVIGVLALMLVLGEVGFDLGPFLAGAGIIGVAVAFGAQNVVKDFLSGIFMVLEDQYGVGDVVDLGAASGTVEAIGLRVTRVRDGNGTLWYARNGEVLRVGNKSKGFALVTVDLPVPYGSDVDAAGAAMQAAADELVAEDDFAEAVLEEPTLLGVEEIDVERGVVLRLTVKVRPADQWRIARALRQRIADRLAEDGVRREARNGLDVHTEPARDNTAVPPADGSGGEPPTGPTDSDPIPR